MDERQREILAQVDAAKATDDPTVGPLILFVRRLLRERDLSGCYFPHQHFTLTISRFPESEMDYKPRLTIRSAGRGDDVCLELAVAPEITPVLRWVEERAICLPDLAMAEFDKMYEKLLRASSL